MTDDVIPPEGYGRLRLTVGNALIDYLDEHRHIRRAAVADIVSDAVVLYRTVLEAWERGGEVYIRETPDAETRLLVPYEGFVI